MASRRLLVLTHSAGFKHDYLPVAVKTLKELGEPNGFIVFSTDDCSVVKENFLNVF